MDFVEVRFPQHGKWVLVPPGTTLLAAAARAGVDQASGCTRGQCGTDAVAVTASADDALEPIAEPELGTLERMGLGPGCRLACQARVRCGVVTVLGDAV